MTGKPRTPDPVSSQADSDRDSDTPRRGLTKETIDEIREHVLSGGASSRTHKGHFPKGSSGNPRGRPKQVSIGAVTPPDALEPEGLSAITLRHAARKAKAQSDEGEVEISLKEAVVAKMVREAIRGNTGHSRTFLQIVSRAEAEEAKRKRELFRHWSLVKAEASQLHAQSEAAGEKPPLFIHPDDIELHADSTVTIVGPTEPGDIAGMHYDLSRVEYHLIHIAFHKWVERRYIRRHGCRPTDGILYAELDFWCEQHELPPRLRLTLEDVAARLNRYARMSGRAVHSLLRREAERHGFFPPPRELRVPLIVSKESLEFAKANRISAEHFLPAWLEASAAYWRKRGEHAKAGTS